MVATEPFASFKSPITKRPLRVLMVTGIYPTEERPHKGTFIKSQADSLMAAGVEVEVIHLAPGPLLLRYLRTITQVFLKTRTEAVRYRAWPLWPVVPLFASPMEHAGRRVIPW